MKKILFLLIVIFSTNLSAQNWQLFSPNEVYNFGYSNIHGVKVDSTLIKTNKTEYFFNRILNDTINHNYLIPVYLITDITQPNIFGEKCVKTNDTLIFKNRFNDLIYLIPQRNLNSSWNFINFLNSRIEASIDSVYTDSINQTFDSLKRIVFQYFDSSNTPAGNSINTKKIIISKNNGIVSTFNLYEDIRGNSINNNYKKEYNRLFKSTFQTKAEVLDLNIGDECHLYYTDNPSGNPPKETLINHIVINRIVSSNGDTIKLIIKENKRVKVSHVDYTSNPPSLVYNTTYSSKIFERIIINPSDTLNKLLGFQPKIGTFPNWASIIDISHYIPTPYLVGPTTYNDRMSFNTNFTSYYFDTLQNSWIIPYGSNPYSTHYLSGVTTYQNHLYNNGGAGRIDYHSITYFKKGNETWGQPRIVTGIEAEVSTKKLSFFPNPSSEFIKLSEDITDPKAIFKIINIEGKIVKIESAFQLKKIDISDLANGVYLIELESGNILKTNKLIIKH